jgi:hypothetical protein
MCGHTAILWSETRTLAPFLRAWRLGHKSRSSSQQSRGQLFSLQESKRVPSKPGLHLYTALSTTLPVLQPLFVPQLSQCCARYQSFRLAVSVVNGWPTWISSKSIPSWRMLELRDWIDMSEASSSDFWSSRVEKYGRSKSRMLSFDWKKKSESFCSVCLKYGVPVHWIRP